MQLLGMLAASQRRLLQCTDLHAPVQQTPDHIEQLGWQEALL